jgi:DNA-3-methyladenine glycosylase II
MARLSVRPLPYNGEKARRHLIRADAVLGAIVKELGPLQLRRRGTPYQSLFRALLYQQLAGPAAATIERRLLAMYGNRVPMPGELLTTTAEQMRTAGVSRQKASYLHSLAQYFLESGMTSRKLASLRDDDVIAEVTKIKGIGVWTAQMLLMFCLGRPDVLPTGDLGVQRAIELAYDLGGPPDPAAMAKLAEPWRPYRSAASWYLWRSRDNLTL